MSLRRTFHAHYGRGPDAVVGKPCPGNADRVRGVTHRRSCSGEERRPLSSSHR